MLPHLHFQIPHSLPRIVCALIFSVNLFVLNSSIFMTVGLLVGGWQGWRSPFHCIELDYIDSWRSQNVIPALAFGLLVLRWRAWLHRQGEIIWPSVPHSTNCLQQLYFRIRKTWNNFVIDNLVSYHFVSNTNIQTMDLNDIISSFLTTTSQQRTKKHSQLFCFHIIIFP